MLLPFPLTSCSIKEGLIWDLNPGPLTNRENQETQGKNCGFIIILFFVFPLGGFHFTFCVDFYAVS